MEGKENTMKEGMMKQKCGRKWITNTEDKPDFWSFPNPFRIVMMSSLFLPCLSISSSLSRLPLKVLFLAFAPERTNKDRELTKSADQKLSLNHKDRFVFFSSFI